MNTELAMKHYVQALKVQALNNGSARGLITGLGKVIAKRMACVNGGNDESVTLLWKPTGRRAIAPVRTYYATCADCGFTWEDKRED